jgi:hypothetical protein
MSLISMLRRTCYGCGRKLGWARIAENIVTGHPERAVKQLASKAMGEGWSAGCISSKGEMESRKTRSIDKS